MRLEGWKNPYKSDVGGCQPGWHADIYENGADAMLKALKARGQRVIVKTEVTDNMYGSQRVVSFNENTGWLIFIEEMKE